MAATTPSAFLLLLVLIYTPFLVFSEISPSPSPSLDQGLGSAVSIAVPPSLLVPISPSPVDAASPPAPPLEVHSPASEPSPSPSSSTSTTPSPAPVAADVRHAEDVRTDNSSSETESSGGGMSAGKKAGVAIGVLAAAAFVGLAAVVYRKRQENVRRARYGYNARMMEMI